MTVFVEVRFGTEVGEVVRMSEGTRAEKGKKVLFTDFELEYFQIHHCNHGGPNCSLQSGMSSRGEGSSHFFGASSEEMIATTVLRGSIWLQIGVEVEQGKWSCQQFKPCSQYKAGNATKGFFGYRR